MAKRNKLKKHLKRAVKDRNADLLYDLMYKALDDLGKAEAIKFISEEVLEHLCWDDFNWVEDKYKELENKVKSIQQNPYKLIEEQLGLPYKDNLQKQVEARLQTLDDLSASAYLVNIMRGVTKCHPHLEDFPEWLMVNTLSQERFHRICNLKSTQAREKYLSEVIDDLIGVAMQDLIFAAGGEKEIMHDEENNVHVTRDALCLLSLVWEGDKRSVLEMIADFDQKAS